MPCRGSRGGGHGGCRGSQNLRKTYGQIVAVDDLSFTIDYGDVFALLGPNGAGKSTAVRLLVFGFLWSFSYMLWPTERPAEAPRGGMRESAPLMVTGRRLLRGALAATALGWAAVGLLLGLGIVLPTPNLGLLWPNSVLDQLAAVVEGRASGSQSSPCSASPWPRSRAAPGSAGARSWRRCWGW